MKVLIFLFILPFVVVLHGCKENDESPKKTVGNLIVETTIATDGSGLVNFKATADNAVKFIFYFGEGMDDPLTSPNGNASHTYLSSGTYAVKVQALSEDNLFVEKSQNISIPVNEAPISPIGYTTPTSYAGMSLVWQD